MPVITLEKCFEFTTYALSVGVGFGVGIELFFYGITKAIGLINIKI